MSKRDFRRRIEEAANNPQLKTAMERAVASWSAARERGIADLDFEAAQTRLREIKERSLHNLPELIERFTREAQAVGAVVYLARTPEEATRYVTELARKHGVSLAVKSKSTATEEIELNPALEQAGVRIIETDLGEWICQLAGERPSHVVTPALHKSREEVAELFSKVIGRPLEPDIPNLVEVARQELRRCFVEAQMGITGANVAIAESGTLALVTNEGNGRLVSTLPRIHVAVVGIEKLVATMEEAVAIIKLLVRSATGQRLTSYTTFITGPSRTSDIEKTSVLGVHGPQELHIVLLDNGRSELRDDAELREALYCVKCGACMYLCPPFQVVGGHVFGHIYTGAIGSILTNFYHQPEDAKQPLGLCTGCRLCVEACPSKIDTPRMVKALRERYAREDGLPIWQKMAFQGILRHPRRMQWALRAASLAQLPLTQGQPQLERLPGPASELTSWRTLPALARHMLRDRWAASVPRVESPAGRVTLFAGCLVDFIYPDMGLAAAKALAQRNIATSLPLAQACCGIPALSYGDGETARALAQINIAALEAESADAIITLCPTCALALREDFVRLTKGDRVWEARAESIARRTVDFSEFLSQQGILPNLPEHGRKATFHDPCHLRRSLGVIEQPRELLVGAGYELVEMKEADRCCGMAGSYSLSYPAISRRMLERKLDYLEATSADVVVTACPGCVMQLQGGLAKRQSPMKVKHIAEVLAGAQS